MTNTVKFTAGDYVTFSSAVGYTGYGQITSAYPFNDEYEVEVINADSGCGCNVGETYTFQSDSLTAAEFRWYGPRNG